MPILDAEYIKEQAHKQCFWSDEYGFDVVAFTHAMEQNYSNRIGSKINSLKKKITELEAELAALKAELSEINTAIDDPASDLTLTS